MLAGRGTFALTAMAVEPFALTLCCAAGKSTLTDSLVAAAGIIAMENVSPGLAVAVCKVAA